MSLQIGILGYRFMGKAHANALARLPMFFPDAPEIERDVLVGRDEQALSEAADRFGFARTATDWRDVVEEVDVFYNLGPNHLHAEPSIAALDAGTHVFCEKPLATTTADATAMATSASDSDALAGCAFNYRFVPAIQYAKRLIDAGELGEIRHFRGTYLQDWLADPEAPWSWRNDAELAGSGALGDLGAHTVDLAHFLVGDLASVSGNLKTFVEERPVEGSDETRPVTVDDAYTAQAEFENGAVGTFEASRFATGHKNDHHIEIHGSAGSLRFSLERLNELEVLCEGNRGYETVLVTDEDDPYIDAWWPPGHVIGWEHTFIHENYEFLSTVAEGGTFAPSFADGLAVQRVLDAIEKSDERGERVSV
ncbi:MULTISPECIES: Gfo/Idh/MocA family protein [unclassified Haladaptatus]|uniref:Gfo/Idh/MocA family protein n=1 Tax=unclassified Haladaptatus TaxID=2622732 RepID=UPI0023E76C2F|nr:MULTISPECIES: Gfo/Idh/MocA family oxidoreductase [unclassified Haladaptatus]